MEIKFERWQKWGISLLHLVQRQHLESYYLHYTQKVHVNTTPRLLDVILDRSLTFNTHLKKLTASLTSSIHIIRNTAHTSLGWCCSTLKMALHALIRGKLDYAAPVWQPWLSNTNLSCLYCLQNRSLWLITGHLVFTPLEALRWKSNVRATELAATV